MPEIKAMLFDLDDTLLGNDMEIFLQAYFPMLADYVQPIMDGDRFLTELMTATQAMISNTDPDKTNREVFWSVFCQRTGLDQEQVEPFTKQFYRERFGELENKTKRRPIARRMIQWCFEQQLTVVVATNPLFPFDAIKQRLEWAGIPTEDFNFALITGYENMHSAKPHVTYYQEILNRLNLVADQALMVGDDWENDIVPADRLGLKTFWITEEGIDQPGSPPDSQGSLDELYKKLDAGWLIS